MTSDRLGRECFAAYCKAKNGLADNGRPIQPWESLPGGDTAREAWIAAASAVLNSASDADRAAARLASRRERKVWADPELGLLYIAREDEIAKLVARVMGWEDDDSEIGEEVAGLNILDPRTILRFKGFSLADLRRLPSWMVEPSLPGAPRIYQPLRNYEGENDTVEIEIRLRVQEIIDNSDGNCLFTFVNATVHHLPYDRTPGDSDDVDS